MKKSVEERLEKAKMHGQPIELAPRPVLGLGSLALPVLLAAVVLMVLLFVGGHWLLGVFLPLPLFYAGRRLAKKYYEQHLFTMISHSIGSYYFEFWLHIFIVAGILTVISLVFGISFTELIRNLIDYLESY